MHFLYHLKKKKEKKSFARLEKDLKEKENHWAISLKMALVSLSSQLLISFIQQDAFVGLTVEQGRRLIEKKKKEKPHWYCVLLHCVRTSDDKNTADQTNPRRRVSFSARRRPLRLKPFLPSVSQKRLNNRQPRRVIFICHACPSPFPPRRLASPGRRRRGARPQKSSSSHMSRYTSKASRLQFPSGVNTYLWKVPSTHMAAGRRGGWGREVSATAFPQ